MNAIVKKILSHCKGDAEGCLVWQRYKNSNGYGRIMFEGKVRFAHRLLFSKLNQVPKNFEILQVRHACDKPACCNPDHLLLGTVQDNMDDMYSRGRGRKAAGERNGNARFTNAQVVAIKALIGKKSDCAVARDFNTSSTAIRNIRIGYTRRSA